MQLWSQKEVKQFEDISMRHILCLYLTQFNTCPSVCHTFLRAGETARSLRGSSGRHR